MDIVDNSLEFDYEHPLVQTIQQCDPNKKIIISSSWNEKSPALTLTAITG